MRRGRSLVAENRHRNLPGPSVFIVAFETPGNAMTGRLSVNLRVAACYIQLQAPRRSLDACTKCTRTTCARGHVTQSAPCLREPDISDK